VPKSLQLLAIHPDRVAAAETSIPSEERLTGLVDTFQALADLTRVRLLYALITGPLCVRDLAILVGVSESAVSHQLRYLRDRRLVKPRRDGNVIYYALDDTHVAALFREADYHVDHVYRRLPDHPDR